MSLTFYTPAPYPADEDARQRVVRRLLSRDLDLSVADRAVKEAAALFGVEIAAVTVLDGDRQWLAARVGMDVATTGRSGAFCGYTIAQPDVFHVPDTLDDARFAGNPFVHSGPAIRFYAGAPLIVDGMPLGALCVLSDRPQQRAAESFDRLVALAARVAGDLEAQLPIDLGRTTG